MIETAEKVIASNSEAILHITIKLADGSIADSTKINTKPAKIVLGKGELTEGIEKNLLGMKEKERKEFTLPSSQAYGKPNPANIHTIPRCRFAKTLELAKGVIIEFEKPNGATLLGIVRNVDNDNVVVDFNHPLSGQMLTFLVEIISIAPHSKEILDFFRM